MAFEYLKPYKEAMPPLTMQDIIDHRNLHFMRYGDGEIYAICGGNGVTNIDGHYLGFPDLQVDMLKTITEPKKSILYGLIPIGAHAADKKLDLSGISWVYGDVWRDAYDLGLIPSFFDWLEGKDVVIVGPPHMKRLLSKVSFSHVKVDGKNCYLQKEKKKEELLRLTEKPDVVLFCAGVLSNVLIYELTESFQKSYMLDVGASFDPFCGVISRPNHRMEYR